MGAHRENLASKQGSKSKQEKDTCVRAEARLGRLALLGNRGRHLRRWLSPIPTSRASLVLSRFTSL